MELQKTNKDVMTTNFSTIRGDASLKEAYDAIKMNLEGPSSFAWADCSRQ